MKFFESLHRSIVDPQFYREIQDLSFYNVILFFIKSLLFLSLIGAIAQTYYLVDKNRGIAPHIEQAFRGMEIKGGILDPKTPTPIVPPTYQILPVLDKLTGNQNMLSSDNDSMVIVDTASVRNYVTKVPAVILSLDKAHLILNKNQQFDIPYTALVGGNGSIQFTHNEIRAFLIKRTPVILLSIFLINIVQNLITLLFSVIFLATAAFLFRMERGSQFSKFLKAAFFAITPVIVGIALISISGVKMLWGWHILIFVSTIVLFRGLLASSTTTSNDSGE